MARPLSQLAASATEAARGGPAPRVPEEGPDDVRRAARAFNAMTDQVTRTLESQRQLLSAVGHDLRTPITAMRINSEFIEDEDLRGPNSEKPRGVAGTDRGGAVRRAGRRRRARCARSIWRRWSKACARDWTSWASRVSWEAHAAAPFTCRPNEIRRAVRNLIENAVAYGSKAECGMDAVDGAYQIVVEDEGPGIPEVGPDSACSSRSCGWKRRAARKPAARDWA